MIPRFAALSIAEVTARIWSGLALCEECTCFCILRKRVTTLLLRSERFNVWRARLAADFVLAIAYSKNYGRGRSRSRLRLSRVARVAAHSDVNIDNECLRSRPTPLMREDFCFARLPRRCSAPASLYLSGARWVRACSFAFVALQRALPPLAFA